MLHAAQLGAAPSPRALLLSEFAQLIERHAAASGESRQAPLPLTFYRYAAPSGDDCHFTQAALVFGVRGSKTVTVGARTYRYDAEHGLLALLDMPAVGRVDEASPEAPALCVAFAIDLQRVAELVGQRELPPPDERPLDLEISIGSLPFEVLEAVFRLARLLDTPKHIPALAPLLEQEILYRLLMSSQGVRLRHALQADGRMARISKAVEWIRARYDTPFRIDELAAHVNMSSSSLHQHFKDATTLSPLQFQKRLRLVEARRLLVRRGGDVRLVASTVGYDNLSQFHREYKRLFGTPPLQDISRLRTGT
ncbi:AraC family transcriptional regulator [Pseudorhodoferax sp.]|uniref:AraC family transcriptional regulator n=1 Tax=Pseudorhodoferax sp. TaxID=1993553 RepID=UPI002DD61CDC|nr:AraC family transcriptional regulator [Pseudorhodoferax sp.]